MSDEMRLHVMEAVANAPRRDYPITHIIADDVFPEDFYQSLRANLPDQDAYVKLVDTGRVGDQYSPDRYIWRPKENSSETLPAAKGKFLRDAFKELLTPDFAHLLLQIFEDDIRFRIEDEADLLGDKNDISVESYIIRDHANYSLGPHTDAQNKLISCLIYLPPDDRHAELGTSFYLPKDKSFTCYGGPHYGFENFDYVSTIPFKPNTFVAFPKTKKSFHGVKKVAGEAPVRDIWFIDLKAT